MSDGLRDSERPICAGAGDKKDEQAEDDGLYVAIHFYGSHGETIAGQVVKEGDTYKEDDAGVTLTKAHRILEVPLPERSSLGQIKVVTQTAVLPILPTMALGTENRVYVAFAGGHFRTTLSKEQWDDLLQSITPVSKESPLSPGDLASLGGRRRPQ